MPKSFISDSVNVDWVVSAVLSIYLHLISPRHLGNCQALSSSHSFTYFPLFLALSLLSVFTSSYSEYTLFPWAFFPETLCYYSKGPKLLFCLSKVVNTWVLTSSFLYSNWKVACCAQDCPAGQEPDWTQHLPATCWDRQCSETDSELCHPTGICQGLISVIQGCTFKGSSSNHKSSLHSSTCLDSEDSTWHKETYSLIMFYSFLSTALSLIPCMWWACSKSSDYPPWAHILASLFPFFTIITPERFSL